MKSKEDLKKLSRHGGKKARALATIALASPPKAQALPTAMVVAQAPKPWKWTSKKREAVEMMCTGARKSTIAKTLGVDRKTIHRWIKEPEFTRACREWIDEQHRVRKGRRIQRIGILADSMTSVVTNQMGDLLKAQKEDKGAHLSKDAVAQLSMFLRETREYMAQEREEFGDHAVKRVEGNFSHSFFAQPGDMTVTEQQRANQAVEAGKVGGQSFAEYLAKHGDPALLKIPVGDNPMQALIGAGRALANDPALLAQLYDEEPKDEK